MGGRSGTNRAAWLAVTLAIAACGGSTGSDGQGGSGGGAGAAGAAGGGAIGGTAGAGAGPSTCSTQNPAGCAASACPPNAVCDTSIGCKPSQCTCSGGGWTCTDDCGGGVCVPVGAECGDAAQQIAATLTDHACTTVVRLAAASLSPKAWQVVCGKYAFTDEAGARAAAESATGFGQAGTLLGGPAPEDVWVLWEAPLDFGGVGVVSARSGLAVFGGGIVWAGSGEISFPKDWRDAQLLGFGCPSNAPGWPSSRGFDLQDGTPLDSAVVDQALAVVWSSALPIGLSMVHSTFDAVVLLYPPRVGILDPSVAELVVLISSGWLE
jgi:hypothetical protein